MIQTVCNDYNNALTSIFGKRVDFDTCHNERDFVIRSQEREILCAIEKYHKNKYYINWNFRENVFGKCIIIKTEEIINNCRTPDFSDYEKYYKEAFISRVNMIANNTRNPDKKDKLKLFIDSQEIISDNIDYERCKELRVQIEAIRAS